MSYFDNVKNVLVIAAHPDDEVLGCGGTISKFIKNKINTHILILGSVTTSRYINDDMEQNSNVEFLLKEAENASKIMGVTSLERLNFKDNRFDSVPLIEIIKSISEVKLRIEPDLVLTHDFTDLNIDHRITHQAALTAFRPEIGKKNLKIMTFEILSSTEWQDQAMAVFRPNTYVDICEFIDSKYKAFECYQSELNDFPHPRSIRGIEYLARKRGMEVCLEFAEAFRIVRQIC
jgi:LmbE family N-acetylglucosaminyl deacetylase